MTFLHKFLYTLKQSICCLHLQETISILQNLTCRTFFKKQIVSAPYVLICVYKSIFIDLIFHEKHIDCCKILTKFITQKRVTLKKVISDVQILFLSDAFDCFLSIFWH